MAAQNTAPGTFSYNWTAGPSGGIAAGQGTLSPTLNRAGTFTLIATNTANGCRDTLSTTLTADTVAPIARLLPPGLIDCLHPVQVISGAGSSAGPNLSYTWSVANGGHLTAGQGSNSASVDAAGTYTLLITNAINHCTATATVQAQVDTNAVNALITVPGALTCAQPSLVLSSNGSSTGPSIVSSWLNASGAVVGTGNTLALSTPGNYRLVLFNTANACGDTAIATVVRDTVAPKLSLAAPGPLNCAVNAITLAAQNTAPGTFSYNWTAGPSGGIAAGQGTLSPTLNRAGTFTLIATNTLNGCRDTLATTLTADTVAPIARLLPPALIDCLHPVQVISGAGSSAGPNLSYTWSVANGGRLTAGQGSNSASVDAAGTYTLLITNQLNHCTATAVVSVGIDTVAAKVLALPEDTLTCIQVSTVVAAVGAPVAGGLTYTWTNAAGDPARHQREHQRRCAGHLPIGDTKQCQWLHRQRHRAGFAGQNAPGHRCFACGGFGLRVERNHAYRTTPCTGA